MSRLTEKIIAGLLGLFLLITVGYQVYLGIYGTTKTETVFDYTVSRSIPVQGIAIRSETLIEDRYTGIKNCVYEDGTRVSVGKSIAEFYENDQSNANLRRARELESEIKMLEAAQDSVVNNVTATDVINRDIKEQLGYLTRISERGRFSGMTDVRDNLTSLINRKQIATGKEKNYKSRISALRGEYKNLESKVESSVMFVEAPVSGYFSKIVDGYESKLTTQDTRDFTAKDYLSLIDGEQPKVPDQKIGKIVTDQNWLFAATAEKSNFEFVKPGQEVYINFESINKRIPATVKDVMQEAGDEDRVILILSCNQISGSLLALRKTSAIVSFDQYAGLRVNMAYVRFLDEKRGVYVLDGNTVRFKAVDPVYEDQSFILSRLNPPTTQDGEYLALFDQIITKGNDLYDGKVTK